MTTEPDTAPCYLYVDDLSRKACEGRFDGHLRIERNRGEWMITLGGENSDAVQHSRGETFREAALDALAKK